MRVYSLNHKPWMTQGILKSIHRKHVLYRNFISKRSDDSKLKYTKCKNKLISVIRMAERQYYYDKF